jgi:four helix bundle protein
MRIREFRELHVYRGAFEGAARIFELTKGFPKEEHYSLTDQVRRSSRSVCANIAEAWTKRRYPASLVSKLSDAEVEAAEPQVWLDIAWRCGYLTADTHRELLTGYDHIGAQLAKMMAAPERWCDTPARRLNNAEESPASRLLPSALCPRPSALRPTAVAARRSRRYTRAGPGR